MTNLLATASMITVVPVAQSDLVPAKTMSHKIKNRLALSSLLLVLVHVQSACSQTAKEQAASEIQLTPKASAERHMKDPEAVPITAKWMQANPGRLVVSLDAECNGTNTYYFELNSTKEALFYTRTVIWAAVESKNGDVPLLGVASTHTTTSPSKKLKFSVSLPWIDDRETDAVVEIKELRTFTIDGKATFDGNSAVDVLFANAREPDLTRYNIRVTDPAILQAGKPKSGPH